MSEAVKKTDQPEQELRNGSTLLPKWLLVLGILAAVVVYMFQRGTPVDQAMANAVSGLSVIFVLGVYWLWFVFKGPAGVKIRRAFGWGCILIIVALAGMVRVTGVDGALIPQWQWRWESVADRSLDGIQNLVVPGKVELKSLGDRFDFPGFLGQDRHPFVAAQWSQDPNSDNVTELWRQEIGAGWSAVAAVGGYGVTMEQRGEQEIVSCYDLESGEIRWAHETAIRHETILGGVGPRATPTIDRGIVFSLGPTGNLLSLDGMTGEVLWQKDVLAIVGSTAKQDNTNVAWGRSTSPLVEGDLVIVPGGGPSEGPFVSLLAFHRKTGELAWKGGAEQVSFASPVIYTINGTQQVVVVNESSVAGHDFKTGAQIWKYPWAGSSTSRASNSQPFLAGEDLIFVSKGYGQGATVFRVDGDQGVEIWKNPTIARTKYTNAALVDGRIYSLSDGIMECADLETGVRIWKRGRFNHGQLLVVGEIILVQSEEGELHFLRPTDRGFDTLYQVQALQDRCWATLTLYDNKLILRNSEEVVCYQLPVQR